MPVIELSFPAGKLHATPWGRHVNEGAVEWPPSPWRLLRALVATWHLKAKEDIAEETMRELVNALAENSPTCQLPKASVGHTRHYMPVIEGKNQKTTKIFDAFIHLTEPLRIQWEALLSAEQNRALALLCSRMGYFGRAESLVEAKALLVDSAFQSNSWPLPENEPVPLGTHLTRILSVQPPAAFKAWLDAQTPTVTTTKTAKSKRGKTKAPATLPKDLFEALHADTGDLQTAGWNIPPGSCMVDYVRPDNCFDLPLISLKQSSGPKPVLARFAVTSTVMPRLTRALSVAERIHQTLVAKSGQASIFTGKENGQALTGHQHAHIFCETGKDRDTISHVTIYAGQGFDRHAREAIEKLQRVWGHGGHDLQLVLLGFGNAATFTDTRIFSTARVWRSITPFVSTRHPKTFRDGRPKLDADGWPIGSPAHDLRRLVEASGLPAPTKVEKLPHIEANKRKLRPLEFQTERHTGAGKRSNQSPEAFQITFNEPVSGPLSFGYGSHFGLGLFVPVES